MRLVERPDGRQKWHDEKPASRILTQSIMTRSETATEGPGTAAFGRLMVFLATGFGIGFAPQAPGTFGSLLGLPLAWGIQQLPIWGQYVAPAVCFAVGVPICGIAARRMGVKDPGAIVFDEIAAFSVVFLFVPLHIATAVVGFLLFRLFDISKLW